MHLFIHVCIIFCIICKSYQAQNELTIKASKRKIEELDLFLKNKAHGFNDHINYVRDVVSSNDIDGYIDMMLDEYEKNPKMVTAIKAIKYRKEGAGETFTSVIEHHGKVSIIMLTSRKRDSEFEILWASVEVKFEINSQGFWSWAAGYDDNVTELAKKFNDDVLRGYLLTKVAGRARFQIKYDES